jgi:hypothetical protein
LLSVGDLAMEASQNLGLLLDQLKFPQVRSLSSSMTIVFINRFLGLLPFIFVPEFLLIHNGVPKFLFTFLPMSTLRFRSYIIPFENVISDDVIS